MSGDFFWSDARSVAKSGASGKPPRPADNAYGDPGKRLRWRPSLVIASAAKQSIDARAEVWIASLRSQ
jgi:hypothetical protein